MKERIADLAYSASHSSILDKLRNGEYQFVFNLDMKSIIKRFNKGDYSVLDSEDIDMFIRTGSQARVLVNYVISLRRLLSYKKDFYFEVLRKKTAMTYNPSDIYAHVNYYCPVDVTYGQVENGIKMAEGLLKDKRIYQILNFYLKYESIIKELEERKNAVASMDHTSETKSEFFELLKVKDDDIGIVRVEDNEKGVKIFAGTRRDMRMSDLIGKPYLADRDEPGYDYGPHGDYYMPPKKTTKTFHKEDLTPVHMTMIKAEKIKRSRLALVKSEELGYIKGKHGIIVITKKELAEAGICPDEVGWKSLRLETKPKRIYGVIDTSRDYVPTPKQVIGMKKELLLKGKIKKI